MRHAPISLAFLWLAAAFAPAAGQEPVLPANDGWVTDQAGLLTGEEERSLESLMESYKLGSGQDVALVTLEGLGGRPIEEVALAIAREWRLGSEDLSDGVLLLVARQERELRIEVGRGLEGRITDSIAGRIIRDVIVPEFRAERYHAGLRRGIEAIHAAAGGDYAPLERSQGARRGAEALGELFVVLLGLFFLFVILRGGRGTRGRSSVLPWLLYSMAASSGRRGGSLGGGSRGGGFSGFGGGGGFSGGGASGRW